MTDAMTDDVFDPNAVAEKAAEKTAPKTDKKTDKTAEKKSGKADKKADTDPALDLTVTPLKIESDVPLPENNAGRKTAFNANRMPFGALEVGQSFSEVLADGKTRDGITVKTVMAQVKKAFPDRTFVVRETMEGDVATSARFWRKK